MIASASKPCVLPPSAPEAGQVKRLGFLAGDLAIPEDFDAMGQQEIEQFFGDDA